MTNPQHRTKWCVRHKHPQPSNGCLTVVYEQVGGGSLDAETGGPPVEFCQLWLRYCEGIAYNKGWTHSLKKKTRPCDGKFQPDSSLRIVTMLPQGFINANEHNFYLLVLGFVFFSSVACCNNKNSNVFIHTTLLNTTLQSTYKYTHATQL